MNNVHTIIKNNQRSSKTQLPQNCYRFVRKNIKRSGKTISTSLWKLPINKEKLHDILKIFIAVLFGSFIITQTAFAQGGDIQFGKSLGSSVVMAFKYIKIAVQIGLAIWFIISVVQGVLNKHNKETNWWNVVGIFGVIAFLEVAMGVYNAIAGTSAYIK